MLKKFFEILTGIGLLLFLLFGIAHLIAILHEKELEERQEISAYIDQYIKETEQ